MSSNRNLVSIAGSFLVGAVFVLAGSAAGAEERKGDVYPLSTCPVSGQALGSMGEPVVYDHNGREIRFCCGGCPKQFEANPEDYLKKINEAIIEQQLPFYPLDTCLVSGQKLGSMGEPVNLVHNNRLLRFCCKGCVSTFQNDPEKSLSRLDEAIIAKQKADYPLDTCVVSGQKLGAMGEPVDYVTGNRLVRFCCQGCVGSFEKHPPKYLKIIDEAARSKTSGKDGGQSEQG